MIEIIKWQILGEELRKQAERELGLAPQPLTVGAKIRAFREKHNLTQEDLAGKVDISVRVLRDHEQGIKIPRGTTLQKYRDIAKIFGSTL